MASETEGFDSPNPVRTRPAVDVVMTIVLAWEGVGDEDQLPRFGEGFENVADMFLGNMLQEFTRPDQVRRIRRQVGTFTKIVANDAIRDHAVAQGLLTAFDPRDGAAESPEEPGRVPLAAAHVQHRAHLELT